MEAVWVDEPQLDALRERLKLMLKIQKQDLSAQVTTEMPHGVLREASQWPAHGALITPAVLAATKFLHALKHPPGPPHRALQPAPGWDGRRHRRHRAWRCHR